MKPRGIAGGANSPRSKKGNTSLKRPLEQPEVLELAVRVCSWMGGTSGGFMP